MNKAKIGFLSSMTIFGTVGIFVLKIPLPSATIAFFRGVLGLLFLSVVMLCTGKRLDTQSVRRNLPILLLSGAAIGGNWILLFEAYRDTAASADTAVAVATVCYYLAPTFLMLASPLLGERLTVKKLLLSGAALLGMVFVSGVLKGGMSGSRSIACGVGAAVLYASVMFLNKKLHPIPAYDKTMVQLGMAALVIFPYCLLSHGFDMTAMNTTGWIVLAVVGIVHTGFAYWLYFGTMGQLPAQTVAIFSYLDPVLAIVLSALLLHESFGWQEGIGAVMILGSAILGELPGKKIEKMG